MTALAWFYVLLRYHQEIRKGWRRGVRGNANHWRMECFEFNGETAYLMYPLS